MFDNTNNKMGRRVFTGVALQSIQQLSGINAIMFYAPRIFKHFFGATGGIYGALALNVINFFSTFVTMATIDRSEIYYIVDNCLIEYLSHLFVKSDARSFSSPEASPCAWPSFQPLC